MSTQAHTTRTHSSNRLLAGSACTYLTLALAIGVHAAFYLVCLAAIIALWAVAYRRIQLVRWGHPPAARIVAVEAPPLLP